MNQLRNLSLCALRATVRAFVLAVDAAAVFLAFLCLIVFGAVSLAGLGIYSSWRLLRR